jgi:uncharacterized membrane protein YhaH (DUF805 family)
MASSVFGLLRYDRPLARLPYLAYGVSLGVVKFALDWSIAAAAFGNNWAPLSYVLLPSHAAGVHALPQQEAWFFSTLLLASIPFVTVGVLLTARRMRDAGVPVGLLFLFFVPLVNVLFFLLLVLLPSRPGEPAPPPGEDEERARWRRIRSAHRRVTRESRAAEFVVALVVSVPITLALVALSTFGLGNYGWGVFVGAPFCLGFFSVALFGLNRPQGVAECLGVALTAATVVGVGMLVLAMEGAVCLIMAAPLGYGLVLLGALLGYTVQARPWQSAHTPTLLLALALALPGLMAAESAAPAEPGLLACRSVVEVDAPPGVVWQNVIAFPELPAPREFLFRAGAAYPVRAEIEGHGVGAVRRCVFSTGAFVEPIEVWDAPHRLAFRVSDQPEPMVEWSPFDIHPPHLDHYLVSRRGEFRLTQLPGGRTRLEGRTWYTNRMWPAWYWGLWSDHIIHQVHLRVLDHIKRHSEGRE